MSLEEDNFDIVHDLYSKEMLCVNKSMFGKFSQLQNELSGDRVVEFHKTYD